MPGEQAWVVLDENGDPLDGASALSDPDEVVAVEPTAWWTTAWGSVELAGNPPPPASPPADQIKAPATRIEPGAG